MNIRTCSPIYSMLPMEIEGFGPLAELALDMRWSWNHEADELWKLIDPGLWDLTHNPWVILQSVSRERIERLSSDPGFCRIVDDLVQAKRQATDASTWFTEAYGKAPLSCVAYFCMEFMLSEALPIYSGGLGNVAGDLLKSASDLGVPVVGVGLLYQQGYFRQVIDKNGAQHALFPYNDPGQLPITPLRKPDGEWLRMEISLPGYRVWLRTWQVQVGRVKLFLLDSNDPANFPAHRGITSELYGGGPELRLMQEIVLGIGGWRLLCALGLKPDICHLNEGHSALVVLERASSCMQETGQPFEAALTITRAGNLFTTHTAVAAGFDRFDPALVRQYLGGYATERLGISLEEILALGRRNPEDASEPFNMAYLAIRGSGAVNSVSRLHGKVSRHLFGSIFSRWPEREVPVDHITNGVHMPSWDSKEADDLWTKSCGKDRWMGTTENLNEDIQKIPDEQLWGVRTTARRSLIEYARDCLCMQLAVSGASSGDVLEARSLFDPGVLTMGFARRFATYKRPNLLLHDPDRLLRILTNPRRPVQLILAGKAHPADEMSQAMIQDWIRFIRRTEARSHVIFISDYDMLLTEQLVQGVDVWINTPRRPWEACGTSGMKVLVNGGINLSELDGWWAEAYTSGIGWALGDGKEHEGDPVWDDTEAGALYDLLEQQVIPEFYDRNENGIPLAWVARMRESMSRLTPRFSANRMVREYVEKHYIPGTTAYRARAADGGVLGRQLNDWLRNLKAKWTELNFDGLNITASGEDYLFEIRLCLGSLDPDSVRVELYAEGINGAEPFRHEMARGLQHEGDQNCYVYSARISSIRPSTDYTARVIPCRSGVAVPLEADCILWQR